MPSDRNPVRIEPLISLICYYLKRHELAHALLHKQIDDLWRPRADLEHRDIERMIDKPIKPSSKKKTKFMIDLIIGQGASFIQALPESDGGENPRRLATLFYNALIEENTGIDLGSDPIGQKKAALYDLFGVRPSQISEIQNIDGDYFGYRRSTTRGAIIRFSLSISHTGNGIYHFENHFRSEFVDWIVKGTGFFTDGNLYLVGNASSREGKDGRGLRCFALRPVPHQELISGLVLTTETESQPIAARIVLVPTLNHENRYSEGRPAPNLGEVLADEAAKRFWVNDEVSVTELDRIIKIAGKERPSDAITRCIRNGTVSTLRFDGCERRSVGFKIPNENYLLDEEYLLQSLVNTGGNPTIHYLRAIAGAELRMKQGKS